MQKNRIITAAKIDERGKGAARLGSRKYADYSIKYRSQSDDRSTKNLLATQWHGRMHGLQRYCIRVPRVHPAM